VRALLVRIYRVDYYGGADHNVVCHDWFVSRREADRFAAAKRRELRGEADEDTHDLSDSVEVVAVEFPTRKADIVEWLNRELIAEPDGL
jgi:hypothetical protein